MLHIHNTLQILEYLILATFNIMHCKHDHCVLRLFSFFRLLTQSDSHGIIIPGPLEPFPLLVASIYIEAGGRR